jgi:hypothetical protein
VPSGWGLTVHAQSDSAESACDWDGPFVIVRFELAPRKLRKMNAHDKQDLNSVDAYDSSVSSSSVSAGWADCVLAALVATPRRESSALRLTAQERTSGAIALLGLIPGCEAALAGRCMPQPQSTVLRHDAQRWFRFVRYQHTVY